jgi:hypothetical protein
MKQSYHWHFVGKTIPRLSFANTPQNPRMFGGDMQVLQVFPSPVPLWQPAAGKLLEFTALCEKISGWPT